ncbi:MAG: serine--tRNA ligase [Pseudomonadota bacterium]
MHDIKFIRENPEAFDAGMAKRGIAPQSAHILKLDEEKRTLQKELQDLQSKRNNFAKEIGMAKSKGGDVSGIMEEAKIVNSRIAELEAASNQDGELEKILAALPNIPADDVPVGSEEEANQIIKTWGSKPEFSFTPKEHFEIGEKLKLMDFERAGKVSGSRFVYLFGGLARLERALASFFLDNNTKEFGYTEVAPPLLVRDNAVFGTGQLPKFGEDLFKTTNGYWLIPTAEVSLTNIVQDEILAEEELPLRFTAYTPCFRSEAGSAGRDTRGLIRHHQFGKVELISITHPDKSQEEHQRMLACAEGLLQKLELPYQVVLLSSEAGFTNKKTYDLEVWLPGQNAYREISSCSNCGDFQARRMKARFRRKDAKNTEFVHTLNGSSLPLSRTIAAIIENHQQADGSIRIPKALIPYMDGLEVIG